MERMSLIKRSYQKRKKEKFKREKEKVKREKKLKY